MDDTGKSIAQGLGAAGLDKLVEAAGQGSYDQPTGEVKPYRFGHDNLASLGDYNGLDAINERFCRLLRDELFSFLRMQPKITFVQPDVETFGQLSEGLDPFLSLTTAHIHQLRSSCLIVLRPDFISLLTNTYFGGELEYGPNERREFTASEARVRSLCVSRILAALEHAWSDLVELEFAERSHEDNPQFLSFTDHHEPVLRSTFLVHLPDVEPSTMEIIYPVQALKLIAPELRSAAYALSINEDSAWRNRMELAAMDIPLTATAQLASLEVPLSELTQLKSGNVLPIDLVLDPKLLVAEFPMFDMTPGEKGRRAAIFLDQRLDAPETEESHP